MARDCDQKVADPGPGQGAVPNRVTAIGIPVTMAVVRPNLNSDFGRNANTV